MVGAMNLSGRLNPGLYLLAAPALFLSGTLLGYLHGCFFAIAGRPEGVPLRGALRRLVLASIYSVPAAGVAWLITTGISVSVVVPSAARASIVVVAAAGWLLGATLCVWAAAEAWSATRRFITRWPRARFALLALVPLLPAMTLWCLHVRPPIPGTAVRLGGAGSVGLAFALTLWLVIPLLLLVLRVIPGGCSTSTNGQEAGS